MRLKSLAASLVTIALLFSALAAQDGQPGEIVSVYDAAKDQTTVRMRPVTIARGGQTEIDWSTVLAHTGRSPQAVGFASFQLIAFSRDGWHFAEGGELVLRADGETISRGRIRREMFRASDGLYAESMFIMLPFETFRRIGGARKIDGQLSGIGFELTAEQRARLRAFVLRMRP
ncbi:MAG TPA: hypothetical protein VGB17_16485 [Pyrinomonadaceae bacterium]|jgi:hypothetical protein